MNKLVNLFSALSIFLMLATISVFVFSQSGARLSVEKYLSFALSVLKSKNESVVKDQYGSNNTTFYKYSFDASLGEIDIQESTTTQEDIDIKDWKIFYEKVYDPYISAISFRYPKDFYVNSTETFFTISYDVNGKLLTTTLSRENINTNLNGFDDSVSTSTKLGEYEYEKTSYIKGKKDEATTTLNIYIPKDDKSFLSIIVSMLPEKESRKYEMIIEKILSTLSIEKNIIPFVIENIKAYPDEVQIKSSRSFETALAYTISVRKLTDHNNFIIFQSIENKNGKEILKLSDLTDLKKRRFTIKLPQLCEKDIKENCIKRKDLPGPYFVVLRGYACSLSGVDIYDCPDEYRLYAKEKKSNPFYIRAPIEFDKPEIIWKKKDGTYNIKASILGNVSGFVYVLVFDDGRYAKMENKEGNLYEVEIMKNLENVNKISIIRVAPDIFLNNFYGEKGYENIVKLGRVLFTKNVSIEK